MTTCAMQETTGRPGHHRMAESAPVFNRDRRARPAPCGGPHSPMANVATLLALIAVVVPI
ncbi:hypothetical protein CJ179_39440 [Rhodococcus sp. ACS1]|nr:hypothetical protein CJ179_39440 [Rhodococcus sp. ACS1]